MLKEKPIIFSAPMIRAIKNTRIGQVAPIDPAFPFKGVTRRILKPQPTESWMRDSVPGWKDYYKNGKKNLWVAKPDLGNWPVGKGEILPPYTPGMLWVREGFCPYDPDHVMDGKRWAYRADVIPGSDSDAARIEYGYKWKSPLFLPREAARFELEVTDVWPERLQDITETDALLEGIRKHTSSGVFGELNSIMKPTARAAFAALWESLHGKDAWELNPWVWRIAFKRVK